MDFERHKSIRDKCINFCTNQRASYYNYDIAEVQFK